MSSQRRGSGTDTSRARRGLRALALAAAGALSLLLLVLSGCGATPLTAQQIFNNSLHSKMKDAKIAVAGTLSSSTSGIDFTLTITGDGHMVVQPTTAIQMTMNMNLASSQINGTIAADIIEVNGKLYTKSQVNIPGVPTGDSSKYSVTDATGSETSFQPTNLSNVKIAGEEVIRGDKCWHLTGAMTQNADGTPVPAGTSGATSVTVEEWVRESDFYLVRIKLASLPGLSLPLGGASAGPGGASSNTGFTIDLSDYDTGVTISAPSADQISA